MSTERRAYNEGKNLKTDAALLLATSVTFFAILYGAIRVDHRHGPNPPQPPATHEPVGKPFNLEKPWIRQ